MDNPIFLNHSPNHRRKCFRAAANRINGSYEQLSTPDSNYLQELGLSNRFSEILLLGDQKTRAIWRIMFYTEPLYLALEQVRKPAFCTLMGKVPELEVENAALSLSLPKGTIVIQELEKVSCGIPGHRGGTVLVDNNLAELDDMTPTAWRKQEELRLLESLSTSEVLIENPENLGSQRHSDGYSLDVVLPTDELNETLIDDYVKSFKAHKEQPFINALLQTDQQSNLVKSRAAVHYCATAIKDYLAVFHKLDEISPDTLLRTFNFKYMPWSRDHIMGFISSLFKLK